MSSLTEIETRELIAERLRQARGRRLVHPRHRWFGPTRPQPFIDTPSRQ